MHDCCLHKKYRLLYLTLCKICIQNFVFHTNDQMTLSFSQILSRVDVVKSPHSNKQMICYIHGTGLLSFKNYKTKHKLSNSICPTSQDKKSQIFFTQYYDKVGCKICLCCKSGKDLRLLTIWVTSIKIFCNIWDLFCAF